MSTRMQKTFTPVRFKGIDPIHPNGNEPERRFAHPNAAPVWQGRAR